MSRKHASLPAAPIAAAHFGTAEQPVDLVVGNSGEPSVALLRNDGSADFVTAANVSLPNGSGGISDVVAADIDGDGSEDIVAANPGGMLVGVARGNSLHQLGDAKILNIGVAPRRLAVGDVVGNANLDVIVATDTNVLILRALDDGSLESAGSITTGGRPADLVVTDVDADGDQDVIVAQPDQNAVHIYLNDGAGAFTSGPSLAVNRPVALVLAPFTGAARPDLAVADDQSHGIAVFPAATGGFETTAIVTPGVVASRLLAAEMTGDQFLDLVVIDLTGGTARVLAGLGDGHFSTDPSIDLTVDAGAPVGGGAVADLDGDSSTDIVLTDPATEDLIIALNQITPRCVGDCNDDGVVAINELVTGTNIMLGDLPIQRCPAFNPDKDSTVAIDELLLGIVNALHGCPP